MADKNLVEKAKFDLKDILLSNMLPILFGVFIIFGLFTTDRALFTVLDEIVQLSLSNAFLVLALIIPILAGVGLNFGIVIGAMAGQIGIILALSWGLTGFKSFLLAIAFATPIAIVLGLLLGLLLHKTHGQEMIASLFTGYALNGVYQGFFLFLLGGLIPFGASKLLLNDGVGLKNTIDLTGTLGSSVDALWQVSIVIVIFFFALVFLAYNTYQLRKTEAKVEILQFVFKIIIPFLIIIFSILIMNTNIFSTNGNIIRRIEFPVVTGLLIGGLAFFIHQISESKIGDVLKTIAHKPKEAKASGLPVKKYKVIAVMLSIVFAAWGQIIHLQNTGMMLTYGSHTGVGVISIIALIIAGASIDKATIGQALLGVLLLQGFMVLAPEILLSIFSRNIYSVLRIIMINGLLVYGFIQTRKNKKSILEKHE